MRILKGTDESVEREASYSVKCLKSQFILTWVGFLFARHMSAYFKDNAYEIHINEGIRTHTLSQNVDLIIYIQIWGIQDVRPQTWGNQ